MENKCEICDSRRRLHFIGIGGVGMYSLARLAKNIGYTVTGSDLAKSPYTESLSALGVKIFYSHAKENVDGAWGIVYSLAVSTDNPELSAALNSGAQIYSRAELFGLLMKKYATRIGVSGSHGKSTTTAMVYHILKHLGLSATAAVGAPISDGLPFCDGSDELLVYEACEYKDSFLKLFPSVVALTNIELDHTDYFSCLDDIKHSFLACVNRAEKFAVINIDDENSASLLPFIKTGVVSYGFSENASVRASIASFCDDGIKYTLIKNNSYCGEYFLKTLGVYNLSNALCAIATVSELLGVPAGYCGAALESFSGVSRRTELLGRLLGRDVIYDYAHHPTEIRAVIDALKLKYRTLTVIFIPHTYTRTRDLWDDFVRALSLADRIVITDIFPAREAPINGISAKRLANAIGESAVYANAVSAVDIALSSDTCAIAVMGAGNADVLLRSLYEKGLDKSGKV